MNESPWISVKERLPLDGVQVLVTNGKDFRRSDHNKFGWTCDPLAGFVTHWMPIPEVPKVDPVKDHMRELNKKWGSLDTIREVPMIYSTWEAALEHAKAKQ